MLHNRSMANGHTRTSVHYREQSATCGARHSNGGFFSVASVAGGRKGVTKWASALRGRLRLLQLFRYRWLSRQRPPALGRSRHSPPVETMEMKVLNRAFFVLVRHCALQSDRWQTVLTRSAHSAQSPKRCLDDWLSAKSHRVRRRRLQAYTWA